MPDRFNLIAGVVISFFATWGLVILGNSSLVSIVVGSASGLILPRVLFSSKQS